jgi:hypothetical protein
MVNYMILEALEEEFEKNLQQYIKDHPLEFVLLKMGLQGIDVSFYKNEEELDKATEKYKGLYGINLLIKKIPSETHRFNEDNEGLYFIDKYIKFCPNDKQNKTELISDGIKTSIDNDGKDIYKEIAYCPDCNCTVFRRPSKEKIKSLENKEKVHFGPMPLNLETLL